jgi:hypothetical protein
MISADAASFQGFFTDDNRRLGRVNLQASIHYSESTCMIFGFADSPLLKSSLSF